MQSSPWQPQTLLVQSGPSKWWSWGLAIFLSLSVFMSFIGIIITAIIPYDMMLGGWEPEEPGEYPTEGTTEEQDEWNATKEEWDSWVAVSGLMESMEDMKPFQVVTGLLICIFGMIAVALLFQQNPAGFKFGYIWLGLSTVSQVWMQYKMKDVMADFYSNARVEETFWMSIQSGVEIGMTLTCNTFMLLIIIMCSMKSQDTGQVEESGFHINSQPQP